MGLGGYLAARSDAEHYASERVREELEVREKPAVGGGGGAAGAPLSYGLTAEDERAHRATPSSERPEAWVDFMMRFELGLEKPDPRARPDQRADHRRRLHRRRVHPPRALPRRRQCTDRRSPSRWWSRSSRWRLRLRQGPLHRRLAGAQRAADRPDRRARGGRGLRDRQGHRVATGREIARLSGCRGALKTPCPRRPKKRPKTPGATGRYRAPSKPIPRRQVADPPRDCLIGVRLPSPARLLLHHREPTESVPRSAAALAPEPGEPPATFCSSSSRHHRQTEEPTGRLR